MKNLEKARRLADSLVLCINQLTDGEKIELTRQGFMPAQRLYILKYLTRLSLACQGKDVTYSRSAKAQTVVQVGS
jgi:hypothetical protein